MAKRQLCSPFPEAMAASLAAASGFDAKRDIGGIVLNRWGHAYCSPQSGFFFGQDGQPAAREILRRAPFGRIAFANTDLSGDPGHATAIEEGQRAAAQLLDRIH
jgi:spermidine dehydrogenase